MRTWTVSRIVSSDLDDVGGISHPGPSPFGHISELGPIFQDRTGSWRPREIDSLGPIQLRPFGGARPRRGRQPREVAEPMPAERWDPEGPVEL